MVEQAIAPITDTDDVEVEGLIGDFHMPGNGCGGIAHVQEKFDFCPN
jgi:hypothetical protein